jgi:hypothetical protein
MKIIREKHNTGCYTYDTTVFYLRGRSAWLNFPDQLDGATTGADRLEGCKESGGVTTVAIRKKAVKASSSSPDAVVPASVHPSLSCSELKWKIIPTVGSSSS